MTSSLTGHWVTPNQQNADNCCFRPDNLLLLICKFLLDESFLADMIGHFARMVRIHATETTCNPVLCKGCMKKGFTVLGLALTVFCFRAMSYAFNRPSGKQMIRHELLLTPALPKSSVLLLTTLIAKALFSRLDS
jgi:hypothetical protein